MPDRMLPKETELKVRKGTSTRQLWRDVNSTKPKSERANPQHYCTDDSPSYRENFEKIDWSK